MVHIYTIITIQSLNFTKMHIARFALVTLQIKLTHWKAVTRHFGLLCGISGPFNTLWVPWESLWWVPATAVHAVTSAAGPLRVQVPGAQCKKRRQKHKQLYDLMVNPRYRRQPLLQEAAVPMWWAWEQIIPDSKISGDKAVGIVPVTHFKEEEVEALNRKNQTPYQSCNFRGAQCRKYSIYWP